MKLQAFLYILVRDHLPFGEVERIVMDLEQHPDSYTFSEEHLAEYAADLATRLTRSFAPKW